MSRATGAGADRTTLATIAALWLALLALWPLFASWEWYGAAAASAAMVILVGALARGLGLPIAVVPIVQGVALLLLTAETLVRTHLWGGILPTFATVEDLRRVIDVGIDSSATYAPPVPVTVGIVALVMIGIGLIALLVDVCMVPLASPVLAGVPILALYAVSVALLSDGAPWWTFAAPAAAWMVLLATEARESMTTWGRRVGDSSPALARGATARRVGLLALACALAIPLAIPAASQPIVLGSGSGLGAGGTGAVIVSPLVSLKRDYLDAGDRQLLTVTGDPGQPQYLRMVTLDRFDGQTWTATTPEPDPAFEMNQGLPRTVPGLAEQTGQVREYTVRVGDLASEYAPMPQPAIGTTIGGGWYYAPESDSVFSRQFSTRGTVYIVSALDASSDAATMRERARRPESDGTQPGPQPAIDVPRVITDTARSVTAGADNPFDQAVALQEWFRTEFRYSTSVRSGADTAYLEQFLTEKVGYCEQFAATMALMARSLGIPSRVAVGFAPGTPTSGGWAVSARDAHAWPELWIPGSGWTRFEPTPRSDVGTAVTAPAYAPGRATSTAVPEPSASASTGETSSPRRDGVQEETSPTDPGAPNAADGPTLWPWLLVLLLGVLAAVPAGIRWHRRTRRLRTDDPAARLRGAWLDVRDSAEDYGRSWADASTPRQVERELVAVMGASGPPALARLRAGGESAVYSGAAAALWEREAGDLAHDLRLVRQGLAARLSWRERVTATMWPASVRRSVRQWRGGRGDPNRGD